MTDIRPPRASFDELAELGTRLLTDVIAIDSQSDERSESIPSTEGQRNLGEHLRRFFEGLGFSVTLDDSANLIAETPATDGCHDAPTLAFMVHIDTSRGTTAIPALNTLPKWDGGRIPYPKNDKLQVTVKNFPETELYMGDDLLFGPGEFPIGLDDKLGMSEMMALAEVLAGDKDIPHGRVLMVCRPDEEIGRMAAVVGLADELKKRGVTHGYTVDGLAPFEVNVENFNAAGGTVRIEGRSIELEAMPKARRVTLRVAGCKSHGATAKAEGYLNATVVFTRALAPLSRRNDIIPIAMQTDLNAETDADITFLLRGQDDLALEAAQDALCKAFAAELVPHDWRGAELTVAKSESADAGAPVTDEGMRLFAHLATFLRMDGPLPKLSEDSDGHEGYTNPHFVQSEDGAMVLAYRFRDFTDEGLAARIQHVGAVCAEGPGPLSLDVTQQYINMGPALAPHPELVRWATDAAEKVDAKVRHDPIRGGTGVDPFLERGIPVANLGTGYFAPESEKEFTSKQMIARHIRWLTALVQVVAQDGQ